MLSLVLGFAAERFPRVAMFMLRDDLAVGIAQAGLAGSGGPDDDAIRTASVRVEGSHWFRSVMETRSALRSPPTGDTDLQLVRQLGNAVPAEAYVAPILGSEGVVALIYADTLPGREPLGDTTALEIVLHEAGLALDRALLTRTLNEEHGESRLGE